MTKKSANKNKQSATQKPLKGLEEENEESQDQNDYPISPDFWDTLLDSLPPWGDEIAAIMLIVFGVVSFLSLLNVSSDATLAAAWSNALTSLFGYGSVIVSGGILGLGVVILLPKLGIVIKFPTQRILALEFTFLSVLAILHLATGDTELRAVARAGEGGGYIGWALSELISGLFGTQVAIGLYGLLLATSIGVFIGINRNHLRQWLENADDTLKHYGNRLTTIQGVPRKQVPAQPLVTYKGHNPLMRIRPDPDHIPDHQPLDPP